jgi:hypothetical protein
MDAGSVGYAVHELAYIQESAAGFGAYGEGGADVNIKEPVRLVEEVPGVPEDERFFIVGLGYPFPHFSTREVAESFLVARGVTEFAFEPFQP